MAVRATALLLLALPAVAGAAVLRAGGTVAGPVVHVADLWDEAGAAGARVLGPAPAPGGRIVVGAAQLGAIARAYGVDWTPQSDADQAVLDRPGAPLALSLVLETLRPALRAQGAGADDPAFDIALPFFDPPILDAQASPRLSVEQLSLDVPSGRFAAVVAVADGQDILRLRLAGTVAETIAVAAPTRRLLPGAIIGAGDLSLQRVRANLVTAAVVLDPAQAVGLTVRHAVFAGQPLPLAELAHPICVRKGDRLIMSLQLPGLDLGATGEALQDGAAGDSIAVRNPVSGARLPATVTGPDRVQVDPDAPPAPPGGASSLTLAAR
jgi:flagella basal body P-ring formation protein FlgA